MNRRTLVCLTFLTLFLFSTLSLITPIIGTAPNIKASGNDNPNTNLPSSPLTPPPEGPSWDGTEYLYEGLGQVLTTQEYSSGTTSTLFVSDLDFGETRLGQIQLPQGWTGYELTANVFNLFDNISHIEGNTRNGNFESGTTSPTYWVESKRGMSGYGLAGIDWYYGASWGETGDGVAVLANCTNPYYDWVSNATYIEYVGWTQVIDLNRIDATSATLSFDVQFYDDGIHGRDDDDEMAVYAEVGGAERVFVCHRYALNAYRGGWGFHPIEFSLSVDELDDWTSDTINVTIGMTVDFDWRINNAFYMEFDNVKLVVRGKPSPISNGIQLRLNSTSSWTDTNYGLGTISLSGSWGPYAADHNIAAIWSTAAALSRNVDFNYTITLKIQRSGQTEAQTGPEGSAFSVTHGEQVYWTSWFFADFYPIYYENYNFTIAKLAGDIWTLSSVFDPNLVNKTDDVLLASDSIYWRLPASLIDAFGWWNFAFTSTNQISSVSGLQSIYRISPRTPNQLSVTVNFDSVTSGNVNLTIYDENHQEIDDVIETISSTTKILTYTFTDGDLFPAGTYDLCISYDNGPTGSHAGFYHATFNIEHDSSLSPETTPISVDYAEGGFVYPRVSYNDIETTGSPFITNTSQTTITGLVSGYPVIIFRQSGSLYQGKVPDDYISPGDHAFVVTANDPIYDSAQTTIWLEVRSDTTLSSPTPGYTAYYQETFTLQVFFEDNAEVGISGAAGWFSTPGWSGTSITAGGSAGWYNIQADSDADGRIPGTYTLTVSVTDPSDYYASQTLDFTIIVRGRNTLLTSTTPSSVPSGISADFSITLSDLDGGSPPDNSTSRLHLSVWLGATQWVAPDASISYSGSPGVWDISIDTLSLGVGQHTFTVNFSWYSISSHNAPYYGNRTVDVIVSIRETGTTIDYDPPSAEPWGNDMVITVRYVIDDPPLSGGITGISKVDVSCELGGVPYAGFGWTSLGGGAYEITIYSSVISQVQVYWLDITINDPTDSYQEASRILTFSIRGHQTQTIVDQPDPTPYGQQTSVTITWRDLDTATDLTDTQLSQLTLEFINSTGLPNELSLSFTLDTSAWNPGSYEIIVTTVPNSNQYLGSSGTLRITILIHQTAVTVLPPEATPVGYTTDITIQWSDLTAGGQIAYTEVENITITGAISDVVFGPLSSWTFTLDTSGLTIGTYSITVTVYAKTTPTQIYEHSTGSLNNGLVIRAHRVYVLVTGPPPVPEDGQIFISISWTDLDTGLSIGTSILDHVEVTYISGPPSHPSLPYTNTTSLSFYIDATGWDTGTFQLNCTVYPLITEPYDTGWGQVNIIIRVHSITADIDPIPRVPFGYDVPITFRVNDSDLLPSMGLPENHIVSIIITGGPSTLTLNSANWATWVNNGTAGDGIYVIILDVSSWALGTYVLTFNVETSVEYGNGFVTTQLTTRPLATSFTYQSPPVVPWGEDGKLIVRFLVDDTDPITTNPITNPISGASISIDTLTLGVDYGFVYWQNGKYNITFYSSHLTFVDEYLFDITINGGAQYDIGQLDDVPLKVRALFTWLHPTDVPVTPFGNDVIIEIEYIVLDGESSQYGDPIHTGSESIIVTGLDGFNPTSVTWEWVSAFSVYRVTIDASEVTNIQAYKIMISISGSGAGYEPDTIPELTFNVRTVFTALAVAPVDAQAYLDNFTIQITYTVNDPDSSLNGWGIDGQASIIELVEYPGLFDVIPFGNGIYNIVINSTNIGAPGSYLANIYTDWTQSPPPYAVQTRQVTLFITNRPTTIQNTIGGEFGYLEEIRVNFTYSDQLRTEWILNTSYGGGLLLISVYNTTPAIPVLIDNAAWYVVTIAGVDAFQLRIDADYFDRVGSFDFKVEVTWQPGTAPYFVAREFEFRAYVYGQRTDIIMQQSAGATPYDTNIIIEFEFITEQGDPINQTDYPDIDISLLCDELHGFGLQGTDWNYTFEGNGLYRIWVDSTRLLGIGSYTFFVNVTYPEGLSPFLESQYNEPVARTVRNITTLLAFKDPGSLYSGDDLNITVRYWNLDNDSAVFNNPPIDYIITGGTTLSNRSLGGGWWEFIVATSGLPAGTEFDIWIYAHQNFYTFQNISIPIYIFKVPLEIDLLTLGVITRYFGETPFPIVIINLTIGAGSDVNDPVTDATVIGTWDHGTLVFANALNGTYWIEISSLYDKGAYFIEIIASKAGYFAEDSRIISYTITAGPSQLDTYLCGPEPGVDEGTSFTLYANQPYFIGVWFRTLSGDNITGAIVTYSSAFTEIGSDVLPEISPGIYGKAFDSSTYGKLIYSMEVVADTATRNVQSQRLQFQMDVRFTPAKMEPSGGTYFISVEYFEDFTITIYLNDTENNLPILNQNITATWSPLSGGSASLYNWTGGYYNFTFPATLAAGFTYELYLDFNGPGSFDCPRTIMTIQIVPRQTNPVDRTGIVSVRDEWNNTINILQVPVGDWLFIYLNYTDAEGIPIPDGEGLVIVGDVSVPGAFHFDINRGLYVAMLNASLFGRGTHSLRVTISKTNYESKAYTTNFEVISIPTELTVVSIDGNPPPITRSANFFIGSIISIRLYLNDTWHNEPIDGATLSLPQTLDASGFEIIALGDGFYEIQGVWSQFSLGPTSMALTVTAEKTQPLTHESASLTDWVMTFEPHPTVLFAVYGGAGAAIVLIVLLMSWILWARVLSIPWEVRRMRKLAKTVEKDETYKLGRKDLKHFHERGMILESKVDSAMTPIGVGVTPAMIPKVEVVEEVTATEEDIMGELDKIPGLGPEEKAVLADEMRKIPRKDRIWFLDDLRRQMGQRRMDFLTQRERPPKPEVEPTTEPEAPKVTPIEPEEPPLEDVKPKEPPPSKALTEDRTAPTVLPPDIQPTPAIPTKVIAEIRRELSKIPGLSQEEKDALVDHLQYLSKEERLATYRSLKMSANEEK
ncbi:MAG: hypothetical protein ACFFCF_02305 [Promethearchaeota archaeon]